MDLLTELAILVLAAFVGFEVISKVPNTLHTPLMSATNAIHGIVLLGAILVIGPADGFLNELLLVIAIAFGTINVVGGFLVTDRMLGMFKGRKPDPKPGGARRASEPRPTGSTCSTSSASRCSSSACTWCAARARRCAATPIAAVGMAIALIGTLLDPRIGDWGLIVVGVAIGTAIGIPAARSVKMTAMPQMVALFNGVGGGAVALISLVEFRESTDIPLEELIPIVFAAIIGSISFWGSNVAFSKLQELSWAKRRFPARPLTLLNIALAAAVLVLAVIIVAGADAEILFWLLLLAAGVLGITAVLPIGGADMPVVISTLNAFTGLSAAAAGVALDNTALIVAGMLVGASGSILTKQMADAMNRSIGNVFFGGFGATAGALAAADDGVDRTVRSTSAADVAIQLSYARLVVVVPGYGMAVAQAQRAVADLAAELEKRDVEVLYAIHPVAGRMPGHMNVLLAEADVPYDKLQRDGRHQRRVRPHRRRADHRRQRRHQPRRAQRPRLADLRHADPRRRQGQLGRRAQALDGVRLRRDRQPAVLRREDRDAVRRREGSR